MPKDMQSQEPTPLEEEILRAILKFFQNNYRYPNNSELRSQIEAGHSRIITQQQLTNYKRRLQNKRWITSRGQQRNTKTIELTDKGKSAINIKSCPQPARLPLFGEVIAGPSDPGDLVVEETGSEHHQSIYIPNINPERQIFVLEVKGASMVESGISEGDYVVVEDCKVEEVQDGDLIVTKYLATKHNRLDGEDLKNHINDLEQYSSHYTVKYCYILADPQKRLINNDGLISIRRVYRLQQQKVKLLAGKIDERSTIITSHILPLGKVVGVYKNIH